MVTNLPFLRDVLFGLPDEGLDFRHWYHKAMVMKRSTQTSDHKALRVNARTAAVTMGCHTISFDLTSWLKCSFTAHDVAQRVHRNNRVPTNLAIEDDIN